MSTPLITPSIKSSGEPTPIKYLGLSTGISGVVYSNTSYISGLGSPTLSPPIAYPGKSIAVISFADCSLKSLYIPPWIIPNNAWFSVFL